MILEEYNYDIETKKQTELDRDKNFHNPKPDYKLDQFFF